MIEGNRQSGSFFSSGDGERVKKNKNLSSDESSEDGEVNH